MSMERTFVMVKPDGVKKGLVGECIRRYEARSLTLVGLRLDRLTPEIAGMHYGEHVGKPFFNGLVEHVTSDSVVLMVLQGEGAIAAVRKTNGATNPLDAEPGTIRGDFALDIGANVVHGSDSPAGAEREIGIFFPDLQS